MENKPRKCPFLDEPCIGEKCAIYLKIQQQHSLGKTIGLCSLPGIALMLSNKPQFPPNVINPLKGIK